MSGIKDLSILAHWMNNGQQAFLEASLLNMRKLPRERQLIITELEKEKRLQSKKKPQTVAKDKPNW